MRRSVRRWSRREKKTKEKEAEVCWVCNEGSFRFFLDFLLGFFFFFGIGRRGAERAGFEFRTSRPTRHRGAPEIIIIDLKSCLVFLLCFLGRLPSHRLLHRRPLSLSLSLSVRRSDAITRAPPPSIKKKKPPKKRKKKKNNTKREKKNKKKREKEMKTRRGFQSSPLDSAPLFFFVSFYLWKKKRSISLFLSFGPIRPGLCCT